MGTPGENCWTEEQKKRAARGETKGGGKGGRETGGGGRRGEGCRGKPGVEAVRADRADAADTARALGDIIARFGFIPYLINNAGVSVKAGVEDLEAEQAARCMQVNALSPLLIMQKLLPGMRERNFGRIVNVTSGAPLNCAPGYGAYSASKAALNVFTVSAARECASCNIKINLMSPGPVRSGMAPDAPLDPSVCHPTADYLLELGADGPTGRFFWLGREIPLVRQDNHPVITQAFAQGHLVHDCLLYTSPSPRDRTRSRMPSSA